VATSTDPHIALLGVSKSFGGARALADVTLDFERGSIHGLVGENGAGKSTLGKIVAGVHTADAGELRVDGSPAHYRSPHEALRDGLTLIAQELALVPQLTVLENVFLGVEDERLGVVDGQALRRRYRELSKDAGFDLAPDARVGGLRIADQQKVEILRALARNARLIVMDEPTAALTRDEAARLFEIVRGLHGRGVTIVYVSHNLNEVLALVETVTVLRDGRVVKTGAAANETPASLVTAMLGRSMEMTFPEPLFPAADAPIVLEVEGLTRTGIVEDISFAVREGEILSLAGLVGSGRTEVARAIFGADRRDRGTIEVAAKRVEIRTPRDAKRAGIAMLPESRRDQGLLMRRSIVENTSLPDLRKVSSGGVLVRRRRERWLVEQLAQRVDLRASGLNATVASLSGGNQQKVLFAKWLFHRPRVLIADEPTRGIDVGAKRAIYNLIRELAAEGMAVVLVSSELEEVLGLSHRILVMRHGRIVAEFDGRTAREEDVMRAAFATESAAA